MSNAPSESYAYYPGLLQDGERQIEDIRPVDAAGAPAHRVYLFDQDGRPIDTGDLCGDGVTSVDPVRPYPRGTTGYDERTGNAWSSHPVRWWWRCRRPAPLRPS